MNFMLKITSPHCIQIKFKRVYFIQTVVFVRSRPLCKFDLFIMLYILYIKC